MKSRNYQPPSSQQSAPPSSQGEEKTTELLFYSYYLLTVSQHYKNNRQQVKLIQNNKDIAAASPTNIYLLIYFYLGEGHLIDGGPANIYLFKVNNRNPRKRCQICSKLTIKTPERGHWRRSSVFAVNFEHISYFFLVFLLLTLNK